MEENMAEQKNIGFIGLGNMGFPMAENLIRAGYDLVVWNRTAEKAHALKGARPAHSPREAASAGMAITMLADDAALETACFGDDGLIAGLGPGGVHVSMSTISVELSKRLAAAHAEAGQNFAAAPVMGRPDAAASAALRILLAGPAAAKEQARPVLECLGSRIFDWGEEAFKGNAAKLGMNFMLAAMLESLAQAQSFAEHCGIEPKAFMEIVNAFFQSPPYENYGRLMTEKNFAPGFRMRLGLKDIGLALNAAREAGARLPLGELAAKDFQVAIDTGRGDDDWAALIELYRKKTT
jgi:3-hydroxyisobutyrate dehydrogenase-like beta-hydroxyacid dehydrogenase